MAVIQDLPTELLSRIFLFLFIGNRREISPWRAFISDQHLETKWNDKAVRSPTLFPYAPARVCRHWRDVLAGFPPNWDKAVFDVPFDPAPMLDSFLWSKDLPLQVFVFNSGSASDQACDASDFELQAASLEYSRVRAITAALTPHVKRCTLLRFELLYPTSVPPASLSFNIIQPVSGSWFSSQEEGKFLIRLLLLELTDHGTSTAPHNPSQSFSS